MRTRSFLITLLISLAFPLLCHADVIHLKNGDRLTGTIVNMEDTKLTFWSKYAGEITLFWQDVETFEIDDTATIVLKPLPPPSEKEVELPPSEPNDISAQPTDLADDETIETIDEIVEPPTEPQLTPDMVLAINPKPIIPVKITARANTKLTSERGNTVKDVYYMNGEYIARTDKNRYAFDGEYEKEEKNSFLSEENWLIHAKLSHFVNKNRYGYIDTLFENDKFKDLKFRSTYGVGVGYQFVESEQANLSFSMGVAWVSDMFYDAENKDFYAGQWALDFNRFLFRNKLQLFHNDKGYVSLENSNDWFIKSKTGLRLPLYNGFTATLQYEYDWDNEPASYNETEEDSKLLLLFGYEYQN